MKIEKILFIGLSCVGDVVMTSPVMLALKEKFPEAIIDFVVDERSKDLYTNIPYLGKIVIKNAQYSNDKSQLDEKCGCYTCTNFSRAYLRHLFLAGELLSHRLLTLHNLYFYASLMKRIRESIVQGKFEELRRDFSGKENEE